VRTLVDSHYPAGTHRVTWDGRDDNGVTVTSGIYLYTLSTENVVSTRKMTLLK